MARHPIIYTSPTGFSIELKWGFIIHEKVDIIVNTTTTDIDLQASPLKDCISSDELSKIRQECRSKAPLSLDLGEYVVTGSGEKNKYIYHGCVIDSSGKINVQDYFDLIKDFFEIADSMNCTKIAIPVLEMKSFSQSKKNTEKEFAMELSKWYESTLAEDSSLGKIHLSLVVTDNDRLHEIYRNVISSLNKQQLSRSGTPITSYPGSSTSPSSTQNTTQNQFDDNTFEILQLTQSLRPATSGGVRPKELQRRNSIESNANTASIKAEIFPSRREMGRSVRCKPDSSSGTNASGQNGSETFPNRDRNGRSAFNTPLSTSGGTQAMAWTTKVYKGDITQVNVDAIVHGTKGIGTFVDMNGVVGQALKNAGGSAFQRQCSNLGADHYGKGIAITGSGNMRFTYVMHVSTLLCSDNYDWKKLIRKCLDNAEALKVKSLAFPAIGAADVKADVQARNFKEVFDEFSKHNCSYLKEVHIVIRHNSMLDEYKHVIEGTVFPSRHNNPTLEAPPRSKSPTKHGTKANSGHAKTYGDFTFKYKNTQITIKEGDVTDEKVDCIVHGFWQTGVGFAGITLFDAVGKALVKKAGAGFEQECNRTLVPKDQMDMTSGFNLCNKVLHVEYSKYTEIGYPSWADFMRRCLGKAANERALNSIAFPPIGTAITNLDTIAQQQIDGLGQFIDTNPGSLKDIRFVEKNDARIIKSFRDAAVTLKTKQAAPLNRGMSGGSSAGSNLIARESRLKRVMHSDKGVELEIIYGDFAKERVDAIVHATNSSMQFIGKAGEAIQKAGGKTFEAKVSKAYFHGKKVVITDAGQLPCKKVLHLDLFAGKTSWFTETKIEKTTRMQVLIHECLAQANKEKLNSIAFPAIGTGKFGCDAKDIAERFKQAISQFILQTHKPTLKEIRIIIFDPSMVQEFIDVLKK